MSLRKQRGTSLTEVILSMVVALGMLLMMARMSSEAGSDTRAKNVAENMQALHAVALQYLTSNREGIQKAVTDGTDADQYCVVGANPATGTGGTTKISLTKKTCAVDIAWLKFKKVAPADMRSENAYNQKLYAVYRFLDTAAATEDFEMLLVGGTNGGNEIETPAKEAGLAAEIMGGNGGFIPPADRGDCQYNGGLKNACGTGGGWKIDLSKYIGA